MTGTRTGRITRVARLEASAPASDHAALDFAATLREEWRRACYELSEAAGWPALPYKPGHAVAPGTANWLKFIARASVPDMVAVVVALREHLATIANPPEPDVVPVA